MRSYRTRLLVLITSVIALSIARPDAQAPLLPAIQLGYTALVNGDVWPADFNRDGITDLVGRALDDSSHLALAVVLGRGDGSFRDPIVSSSRVTPRAIGDLNRDGLVDVIGISDDDSERGTLMSIAGNGDGTLAAATPLASRGSGAFTFAFTADLDGDGIRDVVAGEQPDRVNVYPGLGDLTFGPPITLVSGRGPGEGLSADFNGDGLRDIAVADGDGEAVSIFLNGGGLLFTRTDIALDMPIHDITARDLDGDGMLDLVAAGAARDGALLGESRVYVLIGSGNGTFVPAATFPTARGAYRIVAADFTHDGRTDIATANRSVVATSCGNGRLTYWDTVSILAAQSDGTFAPHVDFSLSSSNEPFDPAFVNTLTSLNTSDLDGDGHTDLIVSGGAVLMNRKPKTNEPPVAEGEGLLADDPIENIIGRATDPDFHALTFTWTDDEGRVVGTEPAPCVAVPTDHSTFTLTVDDGHGGVSTSQVSSFLPTEEVLEITRPGNFEQPILYAGQSYEIAWRREPDLFASFDLFVRDVTLEGDAPLIPISGCLNISGSADRCVWQQPGPASTERRQFVIHGHRSDGLRDAVTASGEFEIRPTASGPLPNDWAEASVGDVAVRGSSRFENGVFTVQGSGADIWGTTDEFHWVNRSIDGDFEAIAHVATIDNVDRWVKAGLMIRAQHLDPSSAHASIFATPGKGIAFQRRRASGEASVHTAGPLFTAPVWLRLVRTGNNVTASYRRAPTEAWTTIGSDSIAIAGPVHVGLAVSSHDDGTLATATFDNVSISPAPAWQSLDVGNVSVAGFDTGAGTNLTVTGGGADIWGTADAFRFVYRPLTGDGSLVARVVSVQHTNAWTKAAVMIRESTGAGSRHAMTLVSAARGAAQQHRPEPDGASASGSILPATAPRWIRIAREGNAFVSSMSDDGILWAEIGRTTIPMGTSALAGIAVASHSSALATAVFDNVRVDP